MSYWYKTQSPAVWAQTLYHVPRQAIWYSISSTHRSPLPGYPWFPLITRVGTARQDIATYGLPTHGIPWYP
eukprot:3151147-Rhodomonas_salina.1